MPFTMERWYSVTGQRFSVRKYQEGPSKEDLEQLQQTAVLLSTKGMKIVLCSSDTVFAPLFLGYGRIKGTQMFAAFVLEKDTPAYVEGYLGEAFALECTALGLGTCWLGMYHKKAALEALTLEDGERLGCIMAIGFGAEHYAARPRKGLDKLTGLTQPQLQALPEWQQRALECGRMAPSAVNGQPWAFRIEGETIRVVNTSLNFGYGKLDCGIAMLHLELGAAHCGVAGEWQQDGEDLVFTPTSYEN